MKFKEVTSKILNEELSISNDVINSTNELFDYITKSLSNCNWENNGKYNLAKFNFNNILENRFFKNIKYITVNVIDVISYENYKKNYTFFSGEYNQATNSLFLKLPFFNNALYDKCAKPIIAHELEHCLQTYFTELKDKENFNKISLFLMDRFKKDSTTYLLSYCIYYLSKPEINAKCHEFIYDLNNIKPNNQNELIKCPSFYEKENVIKKVNEFYLCDEKNIYAVLLMLGMDKEKLFKHLFKMIKYINSKFMKVYQRYVDGIPLLENEIIKEYPHPFNNIIR